MGEKKNKRPYLLPFSILYNGLTGMRNYLYDRGILHSEQFSVPLINVGNLRVGGTGKSPMTDYLVQLLKDSYKIAVLSRGYKRKTKGYVQAVSGSDYTDIGDEAMQIYRKHPGIIVAVSEDRATGIKRLIQTHEDIDIIILDDAFQHRKVHAGWNILLTSYGDLYVDDRVLPAGNLREHKVNADRAQMIVVTKCPETLDEQAQYEIARRLQAGLRQTVFFSRIEYADTVQSEKDSLPVKQLKAYEVLLITGISNPVPLTKKISAVGIHYTHLKFSDHHSYTQSDIAKIKSVYNGIEAANKIILTTEKDYVRIFGRLENVYYWPIRTAFISHGEDFDKMIINYVEQNKRNS